jgi:HSP20 family protein
MNNDMKALSVGLGALLAGGAAYYGLRGSPAPAEVVVYDDFDFPPMSRMHRYMNRVMAEMDREFEALEGSFAAGRNVRRIRMDAFVKDGKFKLVADLPGLKKEDIEVSVRDNMLSVSGSQKSKNDAAGKEGYYLRERSSNSFFRTISLPDGADTDKAETSFSDGVLTITMPVKELPKPQARKLAIK